MEYEPDFARELRGDGDEPVNVKQEGFISAIIVGLILTAANVLIARSASQGDNTITAIAKLETTVAQLTEQVKELKGLPYVRREEFTGLSDRVSGLEARVDQREQWKHR